MSSADPYAAAHQRLSAYMAEHGKKNTRQREVIVEIFLKTGGHMSLQELLDLVQETEPGVGFATVYRTMRMLTEAGVAHQRDFGEGQTRFELAAEDEHHDHLICMDCRHIFEFEDELIEQRQQELASRHGLSIRRHRHEIYGTCQRGLDCPHRRASSDKSE